MLIRPLNINRDLPSLIKLDQLINGERPDHEMLTEYQNYPGELYLYDDEVIKGYISLSKPIWNRVFMIEHLAVGEQFRGSGIGKELVEAMIQRAIALNGRILTVQTATWNHKAVQFYMKLGFTIRGIFPEYFGEKNDMVWLDLKLT